MLRLTLFLALGLVTVLGLRLTPRDANLQLCSAGAAYRLAYTTTGAADEHFITVSRSTPGLAAWRVNVDHTEVLSSFSTAAAARAFVAQLGAETFVVEADDLGTDNSDHVSARRVTAWNVIDATSVTLRLTPTRLDELLQNASITLEKVGSCGSNADATICVGYNTANCETASSSIPIYSNKYLSVTCSNCFVGWVADIFLALEIKLFHLETLSAGLRNMHVNGGLVFSANAQYSWSLAYDKTLPLVKPTTVVKFNIGPIPIDIWFEVPVELQLDMSFMASASAKLGATADWNIGDAFVSWASGSGWSKVTPHPQLSWTPVLSGAAQFDASATAALLPSLIAHFDNVFTFTVSLSPTLHMEVSGAAATKQICVKADADVKLVGTADLDVNLEWVHVVEQHFGPWTWYDSGDVTIFSKCVPAS